MQAQGINSVEIAIRILEILATHKVPMRAVELTKLSGLSKSRLHKYLVSLCRCEIIVQDERTNLYSLGSKLNVLAQAAQKRPAVLTKLNYLLCQLRNDLNISTGIAVLDDSIVCLTKYNRSNKDIDIDYRINVALSFTKSAAGKAFLAFCKDCESKKTLLDPTELKLIIHKGYSVRLEKNIEIPGAKAIACPVFNEEQQMIAAAIMMGFLPETNIEIDALAQQLIATVNKGMQKSYNNSSK